MLGEISPAGPGRSRIDQRRMGHHRRECRRTRSSPNQGTNQASTLSTTCSTPSPPAPALHSRVAHPCRCICPCPDLVQPPLLADLVRMDRHPHRRRTHRPHTPRHRHPDIPADLRRLRPVPPRTHHWPPRLHIPGHPRRQRQPIDRPTRTRPTRTRHPGLGSSPRCRPPRRLRLRRTRSTCDRRTPRIGSNAETVRFDRSGPRAYGNSRPITPEALNVHLVAHSRYGGLVIARHLGQFEYFRSRNRPRGNGPGPCRS